MKCSWLRALRRRGVSGAGSGVDELAVSSMLGMYSLTVAVFYVSFEDCGAQFLGKAARVVAAWSFAVAQAGLQC